MAIVDEGNVLNRSGMFFKGQRVLILKYTKPSNWGAEFNEQMRALIGRIGVVTATSLANGYQVQVDGGANWWYPSTSLELEGSPRPTLVPQTKKKRRVRVGPGPWDEAPCSHLRWTLMGFFRDKLVLVKTLVRTTDTSGKDVEVELTQMDVACKKCNTRMTLRAK